MFKWFWTILSLGAPGTSWQKTAFCDVSSKWNLIKLPVPMASLQNYWNSPATHWVPILQVFLDEASTIKLSVEVGNQQGSLLFSKRTTALIQGIVDRFLYFLFRVSCSNLKINTAIDDHVTSNNLITPNQWAYRKGHTTELLLIHLTEKWRRLVDSGLNVAVAFVVFKKAFDSVSHSHQLEKLPRQFGIDSQLCA